MPSLVLFPDILCLMLSDSKHRAYTISLTRTGVNAFSTCGRCAGPLDIQDIRCFLSIYRDKPHCRAELQYVLPRPITPNGNPSCLQTDHRSLLSSAGCQRVELTASSRVTYLQPITLYLDRNFMTGSSIHCLR